MKRSLATGMVAALFALAGCGGDDGGSGSGGGGDNGYPAEAEENFVKACSSQPNANEAYCKCTFDKIKEDVPFEEFEKAEKAIGSQQEASKETQDALNKAVEECKGEL